MLEKVRDDPFCEGKVMDDFILFNFTYLIISVLTDDVME